MQSNVAGSYQELSANDKNRLNAERNLPQLRQCHHCNFEAVHAYILVDHTRNSHPELRVCHQCNVRFSSVESLNQHGLDTHHAAFKCSCSGCVATFTRLDVYRRHLLQHKDNIARFPCPHCPKYQDENGFIRRDHLTQHLRNFHRIGEPQMSGKNRCCPHRSCPMYRERLYQGTDVNDGPFRTSSEYIAHMRTIHDESPLPCPVPGCTRVGGRGYFRESDLLRHQRNCHGGFREVE